MAIRPARTLRRIESQPWSRYSRKVMKKNFIKAMPHKHLVRQMMGKGSYETAPQMYEYAVLLVAKDSYKHRDNALEAFRKTVNNHMEKRMAGKYLFVIYPYPHWVVRENKMLSGAGADRLQKGMRRAFGKPTHRAAPIYEGEAVAVIFVNGKSGVEEAKEAFRKGKTKLSGSWKVVVVPASQVDEVRTG